MTHENLDSQGDPEVARKLRLLARNLHGSFVPDSALESFDRSDAQTFIFSSILRSSRTPERHPLWPAFDREVRFHDLSELFGYLEACIEGFVVTRDYRDEHDTVLLELAEAICASPRAPGQGAPKLPGAEDARVADVAVRVDGVLAEPGTRLPVDLFDAADQSCANDPEARVLARRTALARWLTGELHARPTSAPHPFDLPMSESI